MHTLELTLYTNQLEENKNFYTQTLGLPLIQETNSFFSLELPESVLTFKKSDQPHVYHFCFLIPSNKIHEAQSWLKQNVNCIPIEGDRYIQNFEAWNADSVYFYDASDNIVEFIVRYSLKNESETPFDETSILRIHEIGTPTRDIAATNEQIEEDMQSYFWWGDKERFGTNGTVDGIFLLPNPSQKKTWFPTEQEIAFSPYEARVKNEQGKKFDVIYRDGKLKIIPNLT